MGLANLVPGISGGTMLVAAGVYTPFIDAISDLTRLRFNRRSITVLAVVVAAAILAIGAGAGIIAAGLASFRWGMYSLFIGLTLGGVPVMLTLLRPMTKPAWFGAAIGAAVMAGLVVLQMQSSADGAASSNPILLVLAGIAGASAMILPGVSGAYLLLLLGQYETIIDAIKTFVKAAASADISAALQTLSVVIPVGIGVVVGVVVVGNLLRFLLHRYEKLTLGFLLGLLIAAPAGLYPFKQGVEPQIGDTIKGQVITEDTIAGALADPKDWPERTFTPTPVQITGALALIALGFAATAGLARLSKPAPPSPRPREEGVGEADG